MKGKFMVYAGIGLFVAVGISATRIPAKEPAFKHLKVLPKNIEDEQLDRIMNNMTRQLGVTCSHCHPDTKPDVFPRRVDFVSEEKPEKQMARKMMRMTDRINKKYFGYINTYDFESLKADVITCNTCHRGLKKPSNIRLFFK
jgi:hypothetical protein